MSTSRTVPEKAFQISIKHGVDIDKDPEGYKRFLRGIDTENPRVIGCPDTVKKYDSGQYTFYMTAAREDAETFKRKVVDAGLSQEVHIDEF